MAKAPTQAAAAAEPKGELTRRRINRGSMRRIERAMTAMDKAMKAFQAEMNLQLFMADEDGKRLGNWPVLEKFAADFKAMEEKVNAEIHPPVKTETPDGE